MANDNEKTPLKIKIEGEQFDKLKKANEEANSDLKDIATQASELMDKAKEAKGAFWDAVHEITGVDRGLNLKFDDSNEDMGFYIIKETDDSGSPITDIIKKLVA